ncbi:hypothetical protein ABIE32_002515 [Comamonas sp. 4034]
MAEKEQEGVKLALGLLTKCKTSLNILTHLLPSLFNRYPGTLGSLVLRQ